MLRTRREPKASVPPLRKPAVLLAWALDGTGAKVRASRLRPADRRRRAPFTCVSCGERLVPHLGAIRVPHFAHLPGSRCPLTSPETALHLDAKERLLVLCADAFAGVRKVSLAARCGGCRRPLPLDIAALGDTAEAEAAVGPLRADVLLRTRGRPALAFEVRVTHAVDAAKEAALAAAGVPFVEIDAREEWERDGKDGTEVGCARSGGFPPCAACATFALAESDRNQGGEAAETAELESYRARGLFGPTTVLRGAWPPALLSSFRCPDCGSPELQIGGRLARHPCPAVGARPVAWRGYGGGLVVLSWWRRPGP